MSTGRLTGALIAVVLTTVLASCKIVSTTGEGAAGPQGFDPAAYAATLWSQEVQPYIAAEAKPATAVLPAIEQDVATAGQTYGYRPGEGSPWAFIVSGTGTVHAVNTASRAGTLDVALDGATPPLVVTLQIGPVIRGNAIRDALPFVSFKDFTNQLEFAEAGKALTALAVEGFAPKIADLQVGDRVTFSGAISLAQGASRVQVTPVVLEETAN